MTRLSGFSAVLVSSLFLVVTAGGQPFLTEGLIAYYPFNGNANDSSGNGFAGTAVAATLTTNRFGQSNSAYYFNGTNSVITLPLSLVQQLAGSAPVSVSAWFYTPPDTTDADHALVSFGTPNIGLVFQIDTVSGMIVYTEWGSQYDVSSPIVVADGQWHQGVFVFDGSSATVYVDGIASRTGPVASNRGSDFGAIGANVGGVEHWQGGIDDVRFYNHALSSNDVAELYTYESAPAPCLPHSAMATAVVTNGFVVGATITDPGCGYTSNPLVLIRGGGGTGATATAVVSNGVVLSVKITDAGVNYTSAPGVYIYSPLGFQVGIVEAVIPTFSGLLIGTNYQLQASPDLKTWTNQGSPFTATNPVMNYSQPIEVAAWNQLYFRLEVIP